MSTASPPSQAQRDREKEKAKRGYRACLHCRSRKAKCDLGDIDAPSEPPCSRCKRESRECVFAPSRRGGNNTKRKMKEESTPPSSGGPPDPSHMPGGGMRTLDSTVSFGGMGMNMVDNPYLSQQQQGIYGQQQHQQQPPMQHRQSFSQPQPQQQHQPQQHQQPQPQQQPNLQRGVSNPYPLPQYPPNHIPDSARQSFSISNLLEPSPNHQSSSTGPSNYFGIPTSSTQFSPADQSTPSQPSHTPHGSSIPSMQPAGHSTPSPKRRRLHLHPPVPAGDPSSIVVADMQNESDALHILALASQHGDRGRNEDERGNAPQPRNMPDQNNKGKGREGSAARDLRDFALVKLGIATKEQVTRLTDIFFKCHHHLLPMVPSYLIPRTPDQLCAFAHNERYLLTTMVIIASRHDTSKAMRQVHDQSWAVMRGWLADIHCLGAPPTVGLVESLLLLAENLPRDPVRAGHQRPEQDDTRAIGFGEEFHSAENRQAWMLIGTAIRSAYGLGIDKLAYMLVPDAERNQELERARLAFTYCYVFDRHVSLRLGKAFWSRGPNICFQGFSSSAQTGPAAASGNFPYLREIKPGEGDYPQDDFASLIQAYIELTQMMSSAHDTLYPNAARTRSLVVYGEYFKYLDELARSLDGFKILWRQKKWTLFPLTDAVWAMFYYTQLYICAFSFQAHVERAAMRADEEYRVLEEQHKASGSTAELPRPPLSLFPRGAAASPDARYIVQCNDAARALLRICVDSLFPGGALPYLPSRYLLWFTYAAIVLLKALYSGAMLRADHAETLRLIDRLCVCFAQTSNDEDNPAARYSRQIKALQQRLSSLSTNTAPNSPTGGHQVPLPPMSARMDPPSAQNNGGGQNSFADNFPWLSSLDNSAINNPNNASPAWQLPVQNQPPNSISFPYPNTPGGVAPPHQQPLSEVNNLHPLDFAANGNGGAGASSLNLGFATLDDWFGSTSANQGEQQDDSNNPFGGLDLQDFWMKVGPGEAQGGFPFR